jgi:hypothetical protein
LNQHFPLAHSCSNGIDRAGELVQRAAADPEVGGCWLGLEPAICGGSRRAGPKALGEHRGEPVERFVIELGKYDVDQSRSVGAGRVIPSRSRRRLSA